MNTEAALGYMYTDSKFQCPAGTAAEAQFIFPSKDRYDRKIYLHVKIVYLANSSQLNIGIKQITKSFINVHKM